MKRFGGSLLFAVVAIIFCLLQPSRALAQPTNDACTNAIEMSIDTLYAIDTSNATSTGDPTNVCSSPFGKGVWFRFTAPRNGTLTLNTCGSDFDTVIGIYTGACGALTDFSCADDNGPGCPGLQASVSFPVTAYTTFYIVVGGSDGAGGNLQFSASVSPPANDQCTGAVPLTNDVRYVMNTIGAAATNDVPWNGCNYPAGYGVWFSYTPTNTDLATVSTAGSEMGTIVEVFTGDCGNPNQLTCAQGQPTMQFQATNGVTYLLYVAGYSSGAPRSGALQIVVEQGSLPNDTCDGTIPLTNGVSNFADTVLATSTGDPLALNGIWYTFTPETNGVVTVSTCGSDFSTALQIYTGNCGTLSALAGGYNPGYGPVCSSNASVSFETAGGVTYYILVGGNSGTVGQLEIQATLSPSLNDHCQYAIPMQDGLIYTRNMVAATTNGDPRLSCDSDFGNGVWYTYTPASNGVVTISTCGSDFETAMQVYRGNCNALTPLPEGCAANYGPACNSNRASVSFEGDNGVTYYVLVGKSYSFTQAGNLQIQAVLSPSLNDRCEDAIPMQDGVVYTRNTVASTSAGDPGTSCTGNSYNGVWYTYTPAGNGVVTVSTCGSDYNTVLQVFSGQCGALSPLYTACNSGYGIACPTNRASLFFEGAAGTTYYILAGALNGRAGNLQIQATIAPLLTNDRCDGAIVLTNGVTYAENTVAATSFGDPYYDSKGVWFSFTPSADGILKVSTCGSDYHTDLDVYTGNCNSLTLVPDGYNWGNGLLCPTDSASVVFPASAGTNYLILVNGYNGSFGNLQIQASLVPPLPNDQCSGAIDIGDGATYSTDTTIATSVGDSTNICGGYNLNGIWYRLTPLATDLITLHLQSTNLHPTLQLFQGTCGQLTYRNCVYNYGGYHVDLTFEGVAGQTYFIQAGAITRTSGNLSITAGAFPPFNDQWSGATPMVPGFKYSMNTAYASSTNDPVPSCDATAGHGVWYSYTPKQDAQVTAETCDSDFETVVQVYSYDGSSLTPIACNDGFGPACATNRASLSFFGKTGTNYFILAAGKNGTFGNLSLSVNSTPPGNDNCDAAIDMTEGVLYTTNTTFASSAGETLPVIKGVWYRFTPTRQGLLLLKTCGSDFSTAFNVYTGACNALTFYNAGVSDGTGVCRSNASAEFSVSPGTTYYINVGGFLLPTNNGNVSIIATMPPPPNDTCANASPLVNGILYRMNTANATETGDPTPLCQTNFGKGVWFTYTPPMSGTVSISTCDGDLDSVLQVYTGGCGALTPVANTCNDDAGPDCNGFTASVHFHGDAGVTYWILVGGYGGAGGSLAITANVLPVLTMQHTGTNSVLYWPQISSGYYPEYTTNLNPPILWKWVPYLSGSAYKDGNYFTTNSTPGNPIYFRLKKLY